MKMKHQPAEKPTGYEQGARGGHHGRFSDGVGRTTRLLVYRPGPSTGGTDG